MEDETSERDGWVYMDEEAEEQEEEETFLDMHD